MLRGEPSPCQVKAFVVASLIYSELAASTVFPPGLNTTFIPRYLTRKISVLVANMTRHPSDNQPTAIDPEVQLQLPLVYLFVGVDYKI
jgi:hypothetical protein